MFVILVELLTITVYRRVFMLLILVELLTITV